MHRLQSLVLAFSLLLVAGWAGAADRPLDFLHALQEAGYGDTAVDYLQMLEQAKKVPPELNAPWDLELSQSYAVGAQNAFNEKEFKESTEKAATHLAKFLKENPNHPEAAKAIMNAAVQSAQKGLDLLRAAKTNPNKEQTAQSLAEAKTAFEEAKPKFAQAMERYKVRFEAVKTQKGKAAEQALADYLDSQLKVSMIDVCLARTISDPKDKDRIALLNSASAVFDKVFQPNRENVLGLEAHMWQGKVEEELDKIDKALDIYEEVLAYAPDTASATAQTVLDPIFAEAEYTRLLLLQKQIKSPAPGQRPRVSENELLAEIKEWLEAYKKNRKNVALNFYQGVAFEYVKACDAAAEKAAAANKRALQNDANAWLVIVVATRSEFQREAREYRLKRGKNANQGVEPKTFDEAFAAAQLAMDSNNSDDAVKYFEKALTLAAKSTEPATITEIKTKLIQARFNVARDFYVKEKYDECLEGAEKIAHDPAAGDIAAVASSMSVQAAYGAYLKATEQDAKDKLFDRMHKNADFTIATWPGKPEADDARMTLGKSSLVLNKLDDAINAFKSVNIKSEKYPLGMYLAGHTYWNRYLQEKQKPEADRNKEQFATDRANAYDLIAKSMEFQKASYDASKPIPKSLLDVQLLLAEIALEGGQADQAVKLLQPLVDDYIAHKPEAFDLTVLRVFTSTVKAYSAKNDLKKGGEVGLQMVELGPDTPQVNGVLIDFTKLLDLERKKAIAEEVSTGSAAARTKKDDTSKMLGDILMKLKERAQLSPASQVFIADTFADLRDSDNATKQYEKLLAKIEAATDAAKKLAAAEADYKSIAAPTDEQTETFHKLQDELKRDAEAGQALGKAKTRIRTQLAGLKRARGDYAGALAEVRALVKDYPNALEPRLEECRILQAQAEMSQDPKQFNDAAAGWGSLRQRLEGLKPRPPEYYEVLYNAANCLVLEAERTKSKDKEAAAVKALQAEKVLNAALFANRNLSGPDMVARYNELAKRAALLQPGRNQSEKKP